MHLLIHIGFFSSPDDSTIAYSFLASNMCRALMSITIYLDYIPM